MKSLKHSVKGVAILTFVAFLFSFTLLNYHYTFNPNFCSNPNLDEYFCRSLWVEERTYYLHFSKVFFGVFFISIGYLFFCWIIEKRNSRYLK